MGKRLDQTKEIIVEVIIRNRICNFKFRAIGPSEYLRKTTILKKLCWASNTFVFLRFENKRRNEVSVFEGSTATFRRRRVQLRIITCGK